MAAHCSGSDDPRRGGRKRPLVAGPLVRRSGRDPDAGRGQAQQRYPYPARGRRPNARLRGQCGRVLAAVEHPRPVRGELEPQGPRPRRGLAGVPRRRRRWRGVLAAGGGQPAGWQGAAGVRSRPHPRRAAAGGRVPERPDEPGGSAGRRGATVRRSGTEDTRPRVVGQTASAQQRKESARPAVPGRIWDEPTFLAELEARHGAPAVELARRIIVWAAEERLPLWWGRGKQDGSFYPLAEHPGGTS